MLKLIIADDERVIRETISTLIDWKQYDIELVGLCSNGLEAYDMILDESPDIVLTDIKMPGLDGLELIKKVSDTDLSTQFIILSGYGEFDYAKKAMKYGVKHYLLKPCNELQIIDSIQDTAKTCYQNSISTYTKANTFQTADNMCHHVLFSIINDAIYQNKPYSETFQTYEPYMDFHFTAYHLFYVYFLEPDCLTEFVRTLREYCASRFAAVTVHGIYVTNTLILFFKDFSGSYHDFITFLSFMRPEGQKVSLEVDHCSYKNLSTLLSEALDKVRRYGMIYYIDQRQILSCCNYNFMMAESEKMYQSVMEGNRTSIDALTDLLCGINDLRFLKQLISSLLLKITTNDPSLSTVQLTESLLTINQIEDLHELKLEMADYLRKLLADRRPQNDVTSMTRQIFEYVDENIQNPNLTLKFIAEQYLFMNTDYVSKKFQKDTGIRFSAYLTNVRLEKAKEFLASGEADKILNVAAAVGCGNNPQYFSKLFKKNTGMTPTAYVAMVHGSGEKQ